MRAFLKEALVGRAPVDRARTWSGFDPSFSRALGERGWIGMTWPRRFGGHERSSLERYVVIEELLAAGAPVAAHWIADRQSGGLLLRFGTPEQCARLLPGIARGETYVCIGMSEPGAGSDLAAVRCRAVPSESGWRLSGQKIWTTNAHRSHYMIALVRTSGSPDDRHRGLSQFIVDLSRPGITIRPIKDMVGDEHFCEVFFDDVELRPDDLVGQEGAGWSQVTAELALERSGPERYLSSYRGLAEILTISSADDPVAALAVGELTARLWVLRQMSLGTAARLEKGLTAEIEACLVKDQGAIFEQELPRILQGLAAQPSTVAGSIAAWEVLDYLSQASASFSLRGGTREILRGIVARGLGLR